MTLKKNPLVFASLVSLAFAPFAAADFEKYLPNGETYALLKVENADALRKHFDENAFAREFKSKVFAPMGSAFRAIDEDDYDEMAREFSAFSDKCFPVRGEFVAAALAGDEVPAVVLIADCGANFTLGHAEKNIRELAKSVEEKFVIKNAKVLGVPAKKIILSDEKFQFVIAVVDGTLVSASTVPALEKIVRAMKSGNASGLSASAAFRKARARIGSANLWFYADGKSIADAIYDYAEKMDKETAEKLAENPESAMFSIMAKPVVKAFAPEAIDSIWASYGTDMFGNPVSETAFAWNEKRGLVAMIADSVRDGFEKPNYPLPADGVYSVSTSNYSVGVSVSRLLEIARRASPLFGLVDMQIQNLKFTNGIDVSAILSDLGYGMSTCTVLAGTGSQQLFVQNIADDARAVDAVEKIFAMLEFEPQKISIPGRPTIFSFPECDFAVSVSGKRLFLGNEELVRTAVDGNASASRADVWKNPNFLAGEKLLPAGGCGLSWTHCGNAVSAFSRQLFSASVERGEGNPILALLTEIPYDEFNWSAVSKSYIKKNELTTRTVFIRNK